MIKTMFEAEERFDAIKDHKPKANKKLNELGEILASAYKIDADRADEMWQYLVDLNVSEDVTNSKFYIAQVFNKISMKLKAEEATHLVAMHPERVQLMLQYGYDGGTLWSCLSTLIKGFLLMDNVENCMVTLDYFFDKFGGLSSDFSEVKYGAVYAIKSSHELLEEKKISKDTVSRLLVELQMLDNTRIQVYAKLMAVILGIEDCSDYETLLDLAIENNEGSCFIELLWLAKNSLDEEVLINKWLEYCENSNDSIMPHPELHNDSDNYEKSKLKWYVDVLMKSEELLNIYFSGKACYALEEGVIRIWIENENWEDFEKYIGQAIIGSDNCYVFGYFFGNIKNYMECYFYSDYMDRKDDYGRSYKIINVKNLNAFEEALAIISAMTVGCEGHESFHEEIKEFMEKASGNVDALNNVGFNETVDERNAEDKLREYIRDFLMSGEENHGYSEKLSKIERQLYEEICKRSSGENPASQLKANYKFANDEEFVEFYFLHVRGGYHTRASYIEACIKKNDVNRAIELVDKLFDVKKYDDYEEPNGWGYQCELTLKYLIESFDRNESYRCSEDVTDEMVSVCKQLVERAIPNLLETSRINIRSELLKIAPDENGKEVYIAQLLEDLEVYTTFPKPRGKGGVLNINRISDEFVNSFEILSKIGRLDVVVQIMTKFASMKDVLNPVKYDTWMSIMSSHLPDEDLVSVYRMNPEIFEAWIQDDSTRESDIRNVAEAFRRVCTWDEFVLFRNMIIRYKGQVEELDTVYKATSKNTETQLLFDGENAKIELDFLEIEGVNPVNYLEINLVTTVKNQEVESVRVVSGKINGIEVEEMESFSVFDDAGPSIGYVVFGEDSEDTLAVHSDFFEKNNVMQVNRIEFEFVLMDEDGKSIENMSAVIIERENSTGEYRVRTKALSKGSTVNTYVRNEKQVEGLDTAFKATSKNTETQLLFDGENAKIELEFLEIEGVNPVDYLEINLVTTVKNQEVESVRVVSGKINGIEVEEMESSSEFDDAGPSIGYDVFGVDSEDTLTVYPDFFEKNNVMRVNRIEFEFVLMDEDGKSIENMSAVIIERENSTGEYRVREKALSKGSTVNTYVRNEKDDNDYEDETVTEEESIRYECGDVFDDVVIFDDEDVTVQFCGVVFYLEHIQLNLWCDSSRSETTNLFIKSLMVNGNSIMYLDFVGAIDKWDSGYLEIDIFGNNDFDYDQIYELELIVEVDDENNRELGETNMVCITLDVDEQMYSVRIRK